METTKKPKLLLVEDGENRRRIFKAWTPPDVELRIAEDGGKALGIVNRMKEGEFAGVMLDHDLLYSPTAGMTQRVTGLDVARVLAQRASELNGTCALVHSNNTVHAPKIEKVLQGANYNVERIRFSDLTEERYREWVKNVTAGL